jgi:hypothetical protein
LTWLFADLLIEFSAGLRRGGDFSCGRLGRDADVAAAAAALGHAGAGGARQAPRVHRQLRLLPLGGARRVSIDPACAGGLPPYLPSVPNQKSNARPGPICICGQSLKSRSPKIHFVTTANLFLAF